jgi:ribA/ribD-fused uncharacterized protein
MPLYFNSRIEETAWLSNMHPHIVYWEGLYYKSAEAAYQAAKLEDPRLRKRFTHFTGYQAKIEGLHVKTRGNWDSIKPAVMEAILRDKFKPGTVLAQRLADTDVAELIEKAPWDSYWGDGKDGKGRNMMGKILMKLRDELQQATE